MKCKLAAIAVLGLLLAFASSLANAQTALPHYAVNLAWLAPTVSTDPVAAYEVFRAPSGSTAFQSLTGNAPSSATLTYLDGTVLPATTYNYIVESVDAQGNLSAQSNIATITLPALLPIGTLIGHTT